MPVVLPANMLAALQKMGYPCASFFFTAITFPPLQIILLSNLKLQK